MIVVENEPAKKKAIAYGALRHRVLLVMCLLP